MSNIMNICEYIWWILQGWGGGLSVCKDDPSSAHTSSFVLTRPLPTTQWNHVTCTKHLHSRYVNYRQNIRNLDIQMESCNMHKTFTLKTGLHKLCHPTIRDESTWSKFGARGEHGDVFLFSNLGLLWFSENLIRYSLHVCLGEVKNNLFSFKHSYLWHFLWRF